MSVLSHIAKTNAGGSSSVSSTSSGVFSATGSPSAPSASAVFARIRASSVSRPGECASSR